MAARCRECQYWIVKGKCACNDPTILRPTRTAALASCAHATPERRRTTYTGRTVTLTTWGSPPNVWVDLREPCAGCTGWVRQYCPRAKECA